MDLNLRAPHVRVAHKYFNPKSASKLEFIVLIWAYLKSFNIVTKKLIEKNSFKILSQNLFLGWKLPFVHIELSKPWSESSHTRSLSEHTLSLTEESVS